MAPRHVAARYTPSLPEQHPGVDDENNDCGAHDHEGTRDEVVHGDGQHVVHEVDILGEAVQDSLSRASIDRKAETRVI